MVFRARLQEPIEAGDGFEFEHHSRGGWGDLRTGHKTYNLWNIIGLGADLSVAAKGMTRAGLARRRRQHMACTWLPPHWEGLKP